MEIPRRRYPRAVVVMRKRVVPRDRRTMRKIRVRNRPTDEANRAAISPVPTRAARGIEITNPVRVRRAVTEKEIVQRRLAVTDRRKREEPPRGPGTRNVNGGRAREADESPDRHRQAEKIGRRDRDREANG